ncbi:MAG TPA: hypothetical protein VFE33_30230 [Thermoanaerobaculia bacterium]|nr:hypothetical protein [Thermoanaerobaculia bacterium]
MKTKQEAQASEHIPSSDAFRETFVFLFDREEAQVVRSFGDLLEDRVLERVVYEERNPGFSYTLEEMFAVATDLWFLKDFLLRISSERRFSDLKPTEKSLSELAERFAPEVADVAERLEQEIQRLISDEQDERPPGNEATAIDG